MSDSGSITAAPRLPLLPATAFVLVWCSGYIAGPAAVQASAPFTTLGIRFVLAFLLAGGLALATRRRWRMERSVLVRIALVGLMMNALQFGLMYVAFDAGLSATVGALLHALSPVLTLLLAALLAGERVRGVQVLGFALGVVGVLLVLGPDLSGAGGVLGATLGVISMLTLSLGTLGQRWIGASPDPIWSATVQFGVSAPPLIVLALLVEGTDAVTDPVAATVSLGYLALVNSVIGLVLLGALVRAGGAGAASSLFFLAPPVTAVMAWLILGDTLTSRGLLGLAVAVVGVGVATRSGTAPAPRTGPPG